MRMQMKAKTKLQGFRYSSLLYEPSRGHTKAVIIPKVKEGTYRVQEQNVRSEIFLGIYLCRCRYIQLRCFSHSKDHALPSMPPEYRWNWSADFCWWLIQVHSLCTGQYRIMQNNSMQSEWQPGWKDMPMTKQSVSSAISLFWTHGLLFPLGFCLVPCSSVLAVSGAAWSYHNIASHSAKWPFERKARQPDRTNAPYATHPQNPSKMELKETVRHALPAHRETWKSNVWKTARIIHSLTHILICLDHDLVLQLS